MSGNAGNSSIIQAAKPNVRLKGRQHEYGETQDSDVFARSGRPETDVMDDDRWLEYPKSSRPTKVSATSAEKGSAVIRSPEHHLIWNASTPNSNRNNEVYRAPQEQHLVHALLSRACRLQKDSGPASWNKIKKELGDSMSKDLSMDSTIQFVFVGISALDCQPVVMMRDDPWDETDVELGSDNMKSVALKTLPELSHCKKEIIWLENMMIPGNVSYVKKALWGRLTGVEKRRFLEVMKREHILLADGLNPSGISTLLPSNEEENRKPRFDRSIHNNDCYNYHYRLRWPPIGLLEIPPSMVKALKEFLSSFPFDNVPLNIAIAAVIIFHDLKKGGMKEEAFLTNNTKRGPLGRTTLAQFILYFPHMLRFVELKHLTSFIHPMRFTAVNLNRDTGYLRNFVVRANSLDTTKISA